MQLNHGGDWAGYQSEYGGMPLDFSANMSPLGLPDGVRQAITDALPRADLYPDPLCRALTGALAEHHRIDPAHILCGSGAADLIYRLVLSLRPRRALVTAPSFSEYASALALAGCEVNLHVLREAEDFAVTERFLEDIGPDTDLVFLCEPNNPTGRTTDPALVRRILQKCADCGAVLAVDECFQEFLDEPGKHTLLPLLEEFPKLVLFKAFTKAYAMAGVRLGYVLCADPALLCGMRRAGQPWAVSHLAQAGGIAALRETEYARTLHELVCAQRPRLADGLSALGCRVIPGEANYPLFYHPDPQLIPALRRRGILVRDCANYPGLGPGWVRAAVRTAEDNDRLLRAMGEVLG